MTWWRKASAPDDGVYRLICFAGVTLKPEGEETAIVVLESLRGFLNEAVPIDQLGKMMKWVSPEDAKKDFDRASSHRPHPVSVDELAQKLWSVHPTDIRATGLSRQQWYAKEIQDFISMKRCLKEES